MVSGAKRKWHKHQKNKKLVLDSQLQTYQILTNEAEVLKQSCFSFIIAVLKIYFFSRIAKVLLDKASTLNTVCCALWTKSYFLENVTHLSRTAGAVFAKFSV